ncbi:MAG: permease-like cell division protein FtsX [Clostridia bacterium]|nr:permease-like cell division protein FtsX [Clostridia bacterium]
MKIRTLQLLAKEGSYNVYKNKLMSFASIMTVIATLFFLGIVLLIAVNITSNLEVMKRDLEVTVFLNVDVTPLQREDVKAFIEQKKAAGVVSSYRIETKEQAYANLKEELKNDALLRGLTAANLPESYYIKLTNPSYSETFITDLSMYQGVNKDYGIGYNKAGLDRLEGILKVFNYVTIALLVVLMVVSIFLISNTIRLTVFARRREIEIMKYVGALDSFIRWPFIVEGIIIGFIGAILSFFLTSQAYGWLQNVINSILVNLKLTTLKVMPFSPVAFRILIIYTIFGVIIGGIGSFLSVRKHLNV